MLRSDFVLVTRRATSWPAVTRPFYRGSPRDASIAPCRGDLPWEKGAFPRSPRLGPGTGGRNPGSLAERNVISAQECHPCTAKAPHLVLLASIFNEDSVSPQSEKNYISRRDAGTRSSKWGSILPLSAPPRLCASRFWLRPKAALGRQGRGNERRRTKGRPRNNGLPTTDPRGPLPTTSPEFPRA